MSDQGPSTAREVLIAAREVIALPDNWTQGANARLRDGTRTGSASEIAVCFCSIGAVNRVTVGTDPNLWRRAIEILNRAVSPKSDIAEFNDTHNHKQVLAVFDKAIELAGAQS